ncbi:MAG: ParB/RepB/Spo0J family partition protein [Clostridiales bacterium]|nr:ParB/RepB/Spo0J family partition protein [Clostridiales bacterium]
MVKRGLGKGLDAFFPPSNPIEKKEEVSKKEEIKEGVVELKISEIVINKSQPRKKFNDETLNELAESIKNYGIIQPIVVTKKEDKYEIIAGERRYRAAKIAKIEKVPVIIKEYDEKTKSEVALIENIQRENLNILEKANAYKEIMDTYNISQEKLAEKLGKSRSSIANSLRLLNFNDTVKGYISEDKLTEGHCKVLASIKDKSLQQTLAEKVIEKDLSVRQLEDFVKIASEPISTKQKETKIKEREVWIDDIEEKFKNFFQTKVEIKHGNNKGKIILEYYSNDELERILEIVNGR